MLLNKYLNFFHIILISLLFILGCVLPKPDYDKNRSILIIPIKLNIQTKYEIQTNFTIYIKSIATSEEHIYLLGQGNSKYIYDLPPGKYKIFKVKSDTNGRTKTKNVNIGFVLEQNKITISGYYFYYEQIPSGTWFRWNWRFNNTTDNIKNEIITSLNKQENFSLWNLYNPQKAIIGKARLVQSSKSTLDNCSYKEYQKAVESNTINGFKNFKANV